MLHLGLALNHRAAGRADAAVASAEKALALIEAGGDGAGFVETDARELIEELAAEARKAAA
jgi:hypothetical protein